MKIQSNDLFFTSDLHFGHKNIIGFCDRPYENTEVMDAALINNWNAEVPPNGKVIVLGDIGFCSEKRIVELFSKMNGIKMLIKGNHDHHFSNVTLSKLFKLGVYEQLLLEVTDFEDYKNGIMRTQKIFLNHYPMVSWADSFRGSWQLFGHVHSKDTEDFKEFNSKLNYAQYDVGVDNNGYSPRAYEDLKEIINLRALDKAK